MTRIEFRAKALTLAGRLDSIPPDDVMRWADKDEKGRITLPWPDYHAAIIDWLEFMLPLGLAPSDAAYETTALRGWDNAGLIAGADWDETRRIATTLIRAQKSRGGDILLVAQRFGMPAAILRRLADLSDSRKEI